MIDGKAEKYASSTPYAYALNNPIIFIDPDGQDIEIFYGKNNSHSFVFNGKNGDKATDGFVKDFISAYNYNIENGGGMNLLEAATNPNLNIFVKSAQGYGSGLGPDGNTVYWDSDRALKEWYSPVPGSEYCISPATILEHEFDHQIAFITDSDYETRLLTKDDKYKNAEERQVITGTEKDQAEKNGEINKGQVRHSHGGDLVKVDDPTQNKPNKNELPLFIYPLLSF